jgi:3-oxoacyl-[acyl-carrier-protein] synthase-3
VFKRAVVGMGRAVDTVLKSAGISGDDIDLVIPHQANMRIIEAVCQKLGLSPDQAFVNIQKYGNTSAATIPIALCEALEQKRITPGSKIMTAAFGAGLTWGAGLIQWGDRVEPLNTSDAELPPTDKTAIEILANSIKHCTSSMNS